MLRPFPELGIQGARAYWAADGGSVAAGTSRKPPARAPGRATDVSRSRTGGCQYQEKTEAAAAGNCDASWTEQVLIGASSLHTSLHHLEAAGRSPWVGGTQRGLALSAAVGEWPRRRLASGVSANRSDATTTAHVAPSARTRES